MFLNHCIKHQTIIPQSLNVINSFLLVLYRLSICSTIPVIGQLQKNVPCFSHESFSCKRHTGCWTFFVREFGKIRVFEVGTIFSELFAVIMYDLPNGTAFKALLKDSSSNYLKKTIVFRRMSVLGSILLLNSIL